MGTTSDCLQLRREVEVSARACVRACETTKNCVLPQLKHEGVEFTRHASQFIGCVSACVVEMKRCEALEVGNKEMNNVFEYINGLQKTYKIDDQESDIAAPHI